MYPLVRALLFLLPPEVAHHAALFALELLGASPGLCAALRRRRTRTPLDLSTRAGRLRLPSCVGLAAGLDKDAEAVAGLFALGFGAVEVGTVTPRPQPGNPRPRLFRLPEHHALINRMGFNNAGAAAMAARLRELPSRPAPLGINLGKNKDTPNERALEDYLRCVDALGELADYVVVNASSPNTPGLRELQEPEALRRLLRAVRERLPPDVPLFLKIAPDLGPLAVDAIVDVAVECGLDGIVATNTTVSRPLEHPLASQPGGLSGAPLRELSTAVIRRAFARAAGRLAIVGVGGIETAEHAYEKLRAGASFVQIYTGFVYQGPAMVPALLEGISALLRRDGFTTVEQAIGADVRAG